MASFYLRDYTPPPLVYPYTPFPGFIPAVVQDRFSFAAYSARSAGDDLGVFMVRAWEEFRFPHAKMLHALLDHGHVRRAVDPFFGDSWSWASSPASAMTPREVSSAKEERWQAQNDDFFASDKKQDFLSSDVVAPKISCIGATLV